MKECHGYFLEVIVQALVRGRVCCDRNKPTPRFRPGLEILEDRLTLSTITVTDNSDSVTDHNSLRTPSSTH